MANPLHTHEEFEFVADAPIEVAFPLFGAKAERAWELTPSGRATLVAVTYERTALDDTANAIVRDMAARDKLAGPEWGKQINDYLKVR